MWKLTIEDDEGQRTSLELAQDDYAIGRAEDCAIRLTERNVSRAHAVLRRMDDGWGIEDTESYNGTYINGHRVVEPTKVSVGDIVQLGDYRLELLDAATVQAQQTTDVAAQPRQKRPDRLVMVIGPTPGAEFPLRLHAELLYMSEARWEVVDQGSSNGIRINGMELRRGIIEPGDALELGDVRLRFVAAGKYFRPVVDISQQMPVVVPFEGGGRGGRGLGKLLAFLFVGGVVTLIGFLLFTESSTTTQTGTVEAVEDVSKAKKLLETALQVAEDDISTAHQMLKRIPEDSDLREGEEFKSIEDRWAQMMINKALETEDKKEKTALLNEVADTTSVGAERRQQAADILADMGVAPPKHRVIPRVVRRSTTGGGVKRPPTSKTTATTAAPPPPPPPPPKEPEKFDESAQKRRLMAKVAGGRASMTELRMLKAICMNDGDRACRDMAVAEIRRKKSEGP
jgi:pSer/pThr/pTyr-binding forkhead associated (FHA) protein